MCPPCPNAEQRHTAGKECIPDRTHSRLSISITGVFSGPHTNCIAKARCRGNWCAIFLVFPVLSCYSISNTVNGTRNFWTYYYCIEDLSPSRSPNSFGGTFRARLLNFAVQIPGFYSWHLSDSPRKHNNVPNVGAIDPPLCPYRFQVPGLVPNGHFWPRVRRGSSFEIASSRKRSLSRRIL